MWDMGFSSFWLDFFFVFLFLFAQFMGDGVRFSLLCRSFFVYLS